MENRFGVKIKSLREYFTLPPVFSFLIIYFSEKFCTLAFMKNSIIIINSLILCLTITNCFGQNVNIPDANFKAYLVGNIDINTNGDSEIQVNEANAFSGAIDITLKDVSNLTGIEEFIALTQLNCGFNQLRSLDVSMNTALTKLLCSDNQLTSLDVSKNTALNKLLCGGNQFDCVPIED
jgi:hypothetical protein